MICTEKGFPKFLHDKRKYKKCFTVLSVATHVGCFWYLITMVVADADQASGGWINLMGMVLVWELIVRDVFEVLIQTVLWCVGFKIIAGEM